MDSIYYEKDGGDFVLIHQSESGQKDIMWKGPEVAIGFTYDPDSDRAIQYTTHRHGSPETVDKWAEKNRFALHRSRFNHDAEVGGENAAAVLRSMMPHSIASDQWDVADLNRIIDTTGYLAVVVKKMGITLSAE